MTLKQLGNACAAMGEYKLAVTCLQEAVMILERHEDFIEAAKAIKYLANAHGWLGNYARKRDLLLRALKIQVDHFGSSHIDVAFTMCALGNVYGDQGDHEHKRHFLKTALEIQEKFYGSNHVEASD